MLSTRIDKCQQCGKEFQWLEYSGLANNCRGGWICNSCQVFLEDMKADADAAERIETEIVYE